MHCFVWAEVGSMGCLSLCETDFPSVFQQRTFLLCCFILGASNGTISNKPQTFFCVAQNIEKNQGHIFWFRILWVYTIAGRMPFELVHAHSEPG